MDTKELKQKCSQIVNLIEQTNLSNVYNNIVPFFQMASELYDCCSEIEAIPPKQKSPSIWMRLFSKEQAIKIDKEVGALWHQKRGLIQTIKCCGRNMNRNNRTKKDEKVSKDKIFFGGIQNIGEYPVTTWEEKKMSNPCTYELVARQMLEFMQHKKDGFKLTNWF